MALTIKQRLLAYHIDRRDRIARILAKPVPDSGVFGRNRERLTNEHQLHADAADYLTGLG